MTRSLAMSEQEQDGLDLDAIRDGLAEVIYRASYWEEDVLAAGFHAVPREVADEYAAAILASPWLDARITAAVAERDAEIERLRGELDDRFEHSEHLTAKYYRRMRDAERALAEGVTPAHRAVIAELEQVAAREGVLKRRLDKRDEDLARLREATREWEIEHASVERERDEAREQFAVAERRLGAVAALHAPVEIEPSATICGGCSTLRGSGNSLRYFPTVEWPCETAAVLGPMSGAVEGSVCGARHPDVPNAVPCHLTEGHEEHLSTTGCAGSELRWRTPVAGHEQEVRADELRKAAVAYGHYAQADGAETIRFLRDRADTLAARTPGADS
jgi:hypothetical protein